MDDVSQKIKDLSPWFHNIHLPGGQQTAPEHFLGDFPYFKWEQINEHIPKDMKGWKALDVGCNAGFYSIELAKRGAHVTGIDLDPHYLKQAEWVAQQFGLKEQISLEQKQVYDLARDENEYDLVWFMGVFYHLRYPMLALDILASKVKRYMVFQTLSMPGDEIYQTPDDLPIHQRVVMQKEGWPKMAFIEKRLQKDPTNWWAPNRSCIEAMLRSCGFKIISRPYHETYICEKDPKLTGVAQDWDRSELLAATGQDWRKEVDKKVAKP
jgi:tRNA (mo5U34)-methyltransferase